MKYTRLKKISVINFCFAAICVLTIFTNTYLWQIGLDGYIDEHGIVLLIPLSGLMISALLAFVLMLVMIYKAVSNRSIVNIKLPFVLSLAVFFILAFPVGADMYEKNVETKKLKSCLDDALEAGKPATDGKYEVTLRSCLLDKGK